VPFPDKPEETMSNRKWMLGPTVRMQGAESFSATRREPGAGVFPEDGAPVLRSRRMRRRSSVAFEPDIFPETNFIGPPAKRRSDPCPACRCKAGQSEQRIFVATSLAMMLAAPAGQGGGFLGFLPIVVLIPLLYFMMIRPQQKRQKQWQEMLGSIKSGDRVTTAGGIRGTILHQGRQHCAARGAGWHQARSGQKRHCLGHDPGRAGQLACGRVFSFVRLHQVEKRDDEKESQR